jgi:heme-degrading monooxygenase HmoA
MYASITTAQFRPDSLAELTAIYQRLLPTLQTTPGWLSVYVLANQATGYSQIVHFWETEAAARAFQTSGAFQKLVATEFPKVMVGPPQRELYAILFEGHEGTPLSSG